MLVHPNGTGKTTITNVDADMEQMHCLDIRIMEVYALRGVFELTEEDKIHKTKKRMVEVERHGRLYFELQPHTLYQFDAAHKVEMAEGEAGWIIGRSTLQRNGVIVQSALYDSGYKGGINGTIFNTTNEVARIEVMSRVGQFVVTKAETIKLYEGDYNEK